MPTWHAVPLIALVLTYLPAPVVSQAIVYDSIHNATSIQGTWASGAKNVVTGAGFANPANESFTYPLTTGVSYSFSNDGYYEIARYRFTSNNTQPSCITGVINWSHGTFDLLSNGSIIMNPFGDGYQQVQDPCAATSNLIQNYNYTELYQSWRIFTDPVDGYKLHLFEFDGTPVAPQFQVSAEPNMLPTQSLRNVTTAFTTQNGFVTTGKRMRRSEDTSAAAPRLEDTARSFLVLFTLVGMTLLAL
ncbi:hypothetical protein M0805_000666 [Coniferiporia weirii]|nr:hypothetical protein M0805_000666 [Coniferiporia weirii]